MGHYNYYNGFYDQGFNSAMDSTIMGIVMICLIAMLVSGLFALISYILKGVGMYTIAKRQGRDYAWLAFVPFARTYLHGELAGSITLKNRRIQSPGIWLLALPFIYGAVYSILYAVLWFIGFGAIMKMERYFLYGGVNIGPGHVWGLVILVLLFIIVVVAYMALYKSLKILVNHQIFEEFTSKNMSIVHAVLCTMVPLYESICFFVMRNRPFNPGMGPVEPPPFMQSPPSGASSGYGTNAFTPYGFGGGSAPSGQENREGSAFPGQESREGSSFSGQKGREGSIFSGQESREESVFPGQENFGGDIFPGGQENREEATPPGAEQSEEAMSPKKDSFASQEGTAGVLYMGEKFLESEPESKEKAMEAEQDGTENVTAENMAESGEDEKL